jgi:hypothetical protein
MAKNNKELGLLSFLCAALLLNEIYLPIKFQVEISKAFIVMLWTKIKHEI